MNIALYLLVAALVAGAGVFGVYTYNHAIERAATAEKDRDAWKTNAEAQATINADLKEEGAKKDIALAVRQTQRNIAAEVGRKVDDALSKAKANDPKVREWASTPVPQSVVDGLRNDERGAAPGAKAGAVQTVPGTPPAAAGARVAPATFERGPAQPRPGVPGGGAGVQPR